MKNQGSLVINIAEDYEKARDKLQKREAYLRKIGFRSRHLLDLPPDAREMLRAQLKADGSKGEIPRITVRSNN